jgi:hypothetical protein
VKISRLLELDRTAGEAAGRQNALILPRSLGDRYLFQNNLIFRNIRSTAVAAGFQFSNEESEDYIALPFSQLEKIHASKRIPYVDNVSVLSAIVSQLGENAVWDEVTDGLKRNHVFHEACHAVARTQIAKSSSASSSELRILQILLEESFANTCELLAVVDAQDTSHRIFFEANSYTTLFESRSHLKSAMDEFGAEGLFKYVLFSYLYSNFLYESLDDGVLLESIRISFGAKEFNPKQVKTLRALSRLAFTLDQRFKEVTSRFHLKLSGVKVESLNLQDLQPLELLRRSDPKGSIVECLAKTALIGL